MREKIIRVVCDGSPPKVNYRGRGPGGHDIVLLEFADGSVSEMPAVSYDEALTAAQLAADATPEYRLIVKDGVTVQHHEPIDLYDRSPTERRVPVKYLQVVRHGRVVFSTSVKADSDAPGTITALLASINRDLK